MGEKKRARGHIKKRKETGLGEGLDKFSEQTGRALNVPVAMQVSAK